MYAAEWPIPGEPTVFFLYNPFLPPGEERSLPCDFTRRIQGRVTAFRN